MGAIQLSLNALRNVKGILICMARGAQKLLVSGMHGYHEVVRVVEAGCLREARPVWGARALLAISSKILGGILSRRGG
jgi:hypothetical protein